MPSGNVKIWWDTSVGAYRMVTTYDANFKNVLLQLVPASDRTWNVPEGCKQWTFTEKFLTPVQQLAERCFQTKATVITRAQAEATHKAPTTSEVSPVNKAIVDFFKLLPYEAARKAYIVGAGALHPDKGGSLETMTTFNALWQKIEKEHFRQ